MAATDNSSVQITINVVDANSGEVVSRVTKSLNSLGNAGAGSGGKLKQSLGEAGEAGTQSAKKIADGMDHAGGHTLSALDNVRLMRDDLGIRIPRAMEVVISRSKVAMAAIGAIGTGFVALGAAELLFHVGQEVYGLYEKWMDVNKAVKEYREKAAEASQQKLFDDSSFNSTIGYLRQANAQMDALQVKKKARDNSSLLDNIFLPKSTAPRFTTDDDKHLAQAMEVSDRENLNSLRQEHDLMLKNIEAHGALAKARANSVSAGSVERQAEKQQHLENLRYAGEVERANAAIYNRAHDRDPKKFPGTYKPSKDAGRQEFDADENNADLKLQANATEVGMQQQRELMKLKQEADAVGLAGDRLLQAQRVAAIEDLNAKYKFQTQNNRQYKLEEAEINRRYDAEEQQHLEDQTREVRKRIAEEASRGLTGLAALDARTNAAKGQVDEDLGRHKYYGNKEQQQQYASGLKGAIDQGSAADAMQQQRQFNERVAQLDSARSDRYQSESERITASAQRTVTEITKAWTEEYGQLGALDQRRVSSYQALQQEIVKINADAARQRNEASQRIEDETQKLEREGARVGMPKEREQTQAILDAYADRYQHLEELRQQDATNADKYRRQEIAEEAIKNGKLLDQQRAMRDKLAGELQGLFSNPLEALKRQGEQMASKSAASYLMKLANPAPGTMGTGGKSGGNLFGLPESWTDVGGFNHRQRGAGVPGMAPRPGTFSATPTGGTTLQAATATIHVTNATITGLGGGSRMRNASYNTGGAAAGASGFSETPSSEPGTSAGAATAEPGSVSESDFSNFSGGGVSGGLSQLQDAGNSFSSLGKSLGFMKSSSTSGGSGLGSLLGDGGEAGAGTEQDFAAQLGGGGTGASGGGGLASALGGGDAAGAGAGGAGGAIGGAMGLFSAFEGSGGFGGALKGAVSGAQLGAQVGGPIGAAIGAVGGGVLGYIGFGARHKAAIYDRHTVKPELAAGMLGFEGGSMDYQTVYDSFDKLQLDAKLQTRQMGSGAKGYYNDTIKPEIEAAQKRLTREQKSGRSQFGFSAAQFHTGGLISGFGDLGTSSNEGFIHAMLNERVINPIASTTHATGLDAINSGATHSDMAAYYGGNAGTAPVANAPADVNLHFHSADAKGARDLIMAHKHHIRAALNASYDENSGGYDSV